MVRYDLSLPEVLRVYVAVRGSDSELWPTQAQKNRQRLCLCACIEVLQGAVEPNMLVAGLKIDFSTNE